MSRRNYDLPVGDRDVIDSRPVAPEPEPSLSVTPPAKGVGLGSWLASLERHTCGDSSLDPGDCVACQIAPRKPSADVMAKADRAMARRDAGLCDECDRPNDSDESGTCSACRLEAMNR